MEKETPISTALQSIWDTASESRHDLLTLLNILRELERLHQEIRDTLFQASLPDNRQALYVLLKDIEANGGWPYIYRTRIQDLLEKLKPEDIEELYSHPSTATDGLQPGRESLGD